MQMLLVYVSVGIRTHSMCMPMYSIRPAAVVKDTCCRECILHLPIDLSIGPRDIGSTTYRRVSGQERWACQRVRLQLILTALVDILHRAAGSYCCLHRSLLRGSDLLLLDITHLEDNLADLSRLEVLICFWCILQAHRLSTQECHLLLFLDQQFKGLFEDGTDGTTAESHVDVLAVHHQTVHWPCFGAGRRMSELIHSA